MKETPEKKAATTATAELVRVEVTAAQPVKIGAVLCGAGAVAELSEALAEKLIKAGDDGLSRRSR